MKYTWILPIILSLATSLWGFPQKKLEVLEKAIQLAAQKASPSIVHLRVEAKPLQINVHNPFHRMFSGRGSGDIRTVAERTVSAVILDSTHLLTDANHLSGKVTNIQVVLPSGQKLKAELVARDLRFNLALLKVEKPQNWRPVRWGDSRHLQVGQFVASLGRGHDPKGYSVSFGIISALQRYGGNAIQTDADISPAYTGGLLVDIEGNALGMPVTLIRSVGVNSGIGFAIPAHLIQKAIQRLKKAKKDLLPAFFGIQFRTHPQGGVEILQVVPNSAAYKYGFQKGDRILKADGILLKKDVQLRNLILQKAAGDELHIQFSRKGKVQEKKIILGTRPQRRR